MQRKDKEIKDKTDIGEGIAHVEYWIMKGEYVFKEIINCPVIIERECPEE